jgi:DNA-binding NarL/FixJ family response regulator
MDVPLRRSLAHLIKSCDISIVHDGHAAFDEISSHPFDLLVVDFQLSGIDSLELLESVQYIDPGVPVILMLQQAHQSIKNISGRFRAQPITCPFKPLKFLRMVDKLLHQQLNRYRQLASSLEAALETLRERTSTPCSFLVEENGQLLLANGEVEGALLDTLGNLAVGISILDEELERLFVRDQTLRIHYQSHKDHGLYVVPVTPNLRLAILSPLTAEPQPTAEVWQAMGRAAADIQIGFERYTQGMSSTISTDGDEVGEREPLWQDHVFIPLSLEQVEMDEALSETIEQEYYDSEEEQEIAVNWEILSSNSDLLTRLQNLTHTD